MKDIYELLNEVNIDDIETTEMEVSELERKRGKKKLMLSIRNKKRTSKKIAMVASLVAIIGVSSIVVAKPAWAMDIPIIGDLIQKNLVNNNSNYIDYIEAVGQTKSAEGIDITFESAIADSNILNLSFIVKNNNEKIDNNIIDALLIPTKLKVNGREVDTAGGASYEFIDENTVRVLKNVAWGYGKLPNELNIDIEIDNMFEKSENWDVNFTLDGGEIEKNTYVEKLDKVITTNDIEHKLAEVTITPLTTNIKYYTEKPEEKDILNFIIIDENGKEIKWQGGGQEFPMYGASETSWDYINNTNTKAINITPMHTIKGSDKEGKLPSTKVDIENFSEITLKVNEDISVDIKNCIIDGEFLIIEHMTSYLDTIISNFRLANIYMKKDGENIEINEESITEEMMDMYKKYDDMNDAITVEVVKIGDSRDIEIGAYDGSSIAILKDEAFTVTKK